MGELANKAMQEIIDELPIECSPRLQREIVDIIDSVTRSELAAANNATEELRESFRKRIIDEDAIKSRLEIELAAAKRERDRLDKENWKLVALNLKFEQQRNEARAELNAANQRAEKMREALLPIIKAVDTLCEPRFNVERHGAYLVDVIAFDNLKNAYEVYKRAALDAAKDER